jgi:Fic family protein
MFEHIHPVQDGNGRVGRLLLPLICRWKGVTSAASAFIGEAVHENKDSYIDGLKAARTMNDMTPFVRLFLSFVQQNAAANIGRIDRMENLRRDWQGATQSLRPDSAIHPALLWIADHPVFSVGSMANDLAISFATANQSVRKLSELGIAAPASKDGRNRVFRVPAVLEVFDRFAKKPSR